MTLRRVAFTVTVVLAAEGVAQERGPAGSPLIGDGPLQQVRKPLERLFQFNLDGDRLKLDRERWPKPNKVQDPLPDDDAGDRNPFGRNRFRMGRQEATTPIEVIFAEIQEQSRATGRGMSGGGTGVDRRRERHFSSGILAGRLALRGETIRLTLEEVEAPHRTLEFVAEETGMFRIQLMHADGDLVIVQQSADGRFSAVALAGDETAAGQDRTFMDYFRRHRSDAEARVLPVLAQFGVRPILSPQSPAVRKAVLDVLQRSPEALAEGRKLIAELDSDDFAVRERAGKSLVARFFLVRELIEERLKDATTSPEARVRLQDVQASNLDLTRIDHAIAMFNLLNDPRYLVTLLDGADAPAAAGVIRRLESVAGKKLGADPAAWKKWVSENAK
jgi:hypothetical protein